MFLELLFFRNQDDSKTSLNDHASAISLRYKQSVRKQSLHDRFSDKAVAFMKSLVGEQLKKQITTDLVDTLPYFKTIKIKDSTRFQLPAHLKEHYPGSGGAASGAGVHIQFEFDFLKGEVSDLRVSDAKRQDSTDASETLQMINKGDLIIRDLGYFDQKILNAIDLRQAFYISRVQPKLTLYNCNSEKIDVRQLAQQMKGKGISQMEMLITTNEIKKPVRLFVELLPDEIISRRMAKVRKEAVKKGRNVSKDYQAYATLNLFITNAPSKALSMSQARNLYRLRWQIELRFKAWKSFCQLHKVKKMNRYRFECYLYAKLLYLLVHWQIACNFMSICWQGTARLISINKFYKISTDHVLLLRESILGGTSALINHLENLYSISKTHLLLERRKNKLGAEEILLLFIEKQPKNA